MSVATQSMSLLSKEVQRTCEYFDEKMTDGKKVVRMICFDSKKKAMFDKLSLKEMRKPDAMRY